MRKEALEFMKLLRTCHPLLIGSVWRGTIRRGSDIDIAIYDDNSEQVINILKENGSKITAMEWTDVTKHGKARSSFHIHLETPNKQQIEIVVRSTEEEGERENAKFSGTSLKVST